MICTNKPAGHSLFCKDSVDNESELSFQCHHVFLQITLKSKIQQQFATLETVVMHTYCWQGIS